jgi:hypothetical protein
MKFSFQVQATKQEVAAIQQEESARLNQECALIKEVSYLHSELLIQDHYIYTTGSWPQSRPETKHLDMFKIVKNFSVTGT